MIAQLTGTVRHLIPEKAVVEVGGVGYSVTVTPRTSAQLVLGSLVTLSTTLVVREDSMTLYGFLDMRDRDLFEIVQTVSGIGPKVALAITGSLSPEDLAHAIGGEDVAAIERVPGIGRKGAQRLILELKGKLVAQSPSLPSAAYSSVRDQLLAALTGLGFTSKESDTAINRSLAQLAEDGIDPSQLDIAEILKMTLLSGK